MAGRRLESLYWELDLVSQGMDAGKAKAVAAFREIDKAAEGTQRNLNGVHRAVKTSGEGVARAVAPDPAAIKRAVVQGEQAAREMTRRIKRVFDLAQAETRESLMRGLITPAQARQQGQLAARAYNEGLLRIIERAGDRGQLQGRRGETTLIALTRSFRDVETAGARAAVSIKRFAAPLATLGAQALGAKAGIGGLASSLLLFGAGGPIAVGILATGAAIALLYQKMTAGARAARKSIMDVVDGLIEQGRQAKLATVEGQRAQIVMLEARRLEAELEADRLRGRGGRQRGALGDPLGFGRRRVARAEATVGKFGAAITQAEAALAETIAEQEERAADARERSARAAETIAQKQAAVREAFAGAIAGQTGAREDSLEVQIQKLTRQAEQAKISTVEIAAMVADLRRAAAERLSGESKALADDMRRQLAGLTITQVDDLTLSIERFKESVEEARDAGQTVDESLFARLLGSMEEARALTTEAERLGAVLRRLDRSTAGGTSLIQSMRELQAELGRAEADEQGAKTPEARAAAQDRIRKITAQIAALQNQVADANERTAAAQREIESRTLRIAGGIASAANAAFGLASAMLGVNSAITRALGSIGQMAGGIQSVLKLASTINPATGKAPGLGGLLSSASGIVSALPGIGQAVGGAMALAGSLFGKDPAVAAARKETVDALNRLRAATMELRQSYLSNVSSAQAAADLALVERGAGLGAGGSIGGKRILRPGEGAGPGRRDNLRAIAKALGLDFDSGTFQQRIAELDKRYGTNLSSFIESENPQGFLEALRRMPDALREAIAKLGGFANDAAGVLERVNLQLDLLGENDPARRFRAIVEALKAAGIGAGEFQSMLEKLADESLSAEAREALIREITARLTGGAGGLQLGGLTREQLEALLRQGVGAARGTTAGTGGFNVDRSITEVTGSRIGAMLSTANIWHQKTAENTELIARILAMANGMSSMIPAPSRALVPTGPSDAGSGGIVFGDIHVTVGPGDPRDIGAQIASETVKAIDRALGHEAKWRARSRGRLM